MNALPTRPEDRHRNSRAECRPWADTAPACFRSEAFAEDLAEPAVPSPKPGAARWRLRPGLGGLPSNGLTAISRRAMLGT